MSDGYTRVMDMVVECPQCHKESMVRVATGIEIDTQRKSISCAYCKNPWVEFLPGELVAGPYEIQNLPRRKRSDYLHICSLGPSDFFFDGLSRWKQAHESPDENYPRVLAFTHSRSRP